MLIGELREILKRFIERNFRVDEWGLGLPHSCSSSRLYPSIALDKPALDLIFEDKGVGYGESELRQITTKIPFQVIYRFASTYKYSSLPRAEAEDVLNQAILNLIAYDCLHEDLQEINPTGSVSVAEHKNGDWLVIIEIDFAAKFNSSQLREKSKIFNNA